MAHRYAPEVYSYCAQEIDPISQDYIPEEYLISFNEEGKRFCMDIRNLYHSSRLTGRWINPITRRALPSEVVAELEEFGRQLALQVNIADAVHVTLESYQTIGELILEVVRNIPGNLLENATTYDIIANNESLYDYDLEELLENVFTGQIYADYQRFEPEVRETSLMRLFEFAHQRKTEGVYEALTGVLGEILQLAPTVDFANLEHTEYIVHPQETVGEFLLSSLDSLAGGIPANLLRWKLVTERGESVYRMNLERLVPEGLPGDELYFVLLDEGELPRLQKVLRAYFYLHDLRDYLSLVTPESELPGLAEFVRDKTTTRFRKEDRKTLKKILKGWTYTFAEFLRVLETLLGYKDPQWFIYIAEYGRWVRTRHPEDVRPLIERTVIEGTPEQFRQIPISKYDLEYDLEDLARRQKQPVKRERVLYWMFVATIMMRCHNKSCLTLGATKDRKLVADVIRGEPVTDREEEVLAVLIVLRDPVRLKELLSTMETSGQGNYLIYALEMNFPEALPLLWNLGYSDDELLGTLKSCPEQVLPQLLNFLDSRVDLVPLLEIVMREMSWSNPEVIRAVLSYGPGQEALVANYFLAKNKEGGEILIEHLADESIPKLLARLDLEKTPTWVQTIDSLLHLQRITTEDVHLLLEKADSTDLARIFRESQRQGGPLEQLLLRDPRLPVMSLYRAVLNGYLSYLDSPRIDDGLVQDILMRALSEKLPVWGEILRHPRVTPAIAREALFRSFLREFERDLLTALRESGKVTPEEILDWVLHLTSSGCEGPVSLAKNSEFVQRATVHVLPSHMELAVIKRLAEVPELQQWFQEHPTSYRQYLLKRALEPPGETERG